MTDSNARGSVPRYFCDGEYCPGLSWPASVMQHPYQCAIGSDAEARSQGSKATARRLLDAGNHRDAPFIEIGGNP